MFMAANSGYAEVVSLLVSKGRARVDDREGPSERTPLQAAAISGHARVVELLLVEGNAAADLKDKFGYTALFTASDQGRRIS